MDDESRFALLGGPYCPPQVQVGQEIECALNGRVVVIGWSSGRIPWPQCRITRTTLVLCGDLERAVRRESSQAIRFWWGISLDVITKWRKLLGVAPTNEGTAQLHRRWVEEKLPEDVRAAARQLAHRPEAVRKAVETRRGNG